MTIGVRVVREEREQTAASQQVAALAAILGQVVARRGVGPWMVARVFSGLNALPTWLSPLNGLMPLALRNTITLVDLIPTRRRFKWFHRREARPEPPKRAERIQIT